MSTAKQWPEEWVKMMKTLWAEGQSAAEIAKAISASGTGGSHVSRTAVTGKLYRLGLTKSDKGVRPAPKVAPEPSRVPAIKAEGQTKLTMRVFGGNGRTIERSPSLPLPLILPTGPKRTNTDLLSLRAFQCRYVVRGHGADAVFCGEKTTTEASSWCPEHHARCIQPKPVKQRVGRAWG